MDKDQIANNVTREFFTEGGVLINNPFFVLLVLLILFVFAVVLYYFMDFLDILKKRINNEINPATNTQGDKK